MNKLFKWSDKKSEWLKKNRSASFEEMVNAIANNLLDVRQNQSKNHHNQKVFIVVFKEYTWVIPFEESETEITLKTAFPDRRLLKEFGIENKTDKN